MTHAPALRPGDAGPGPMQPCDTRDNPSVGLGAQYGHCFDVVTLTRPHKPF